MMIPLLFLGCAEEPPVSEAFHQIDLQIVDDGSAVSAAFIDVVSGAERRVQVLLPSLTDDTLADAIVDAHERGLQVEVASDVDVSGDSGFALLEAAGVPVTFGDGGVSYFDFAINADVAWTSEQVVMTHSMIVADEINVVTASNFAPGDGSRLLWTARGEDIGKDMSLEHIQIFGGLDASSRTSYDSLAKSVADPRWMYPTQTDHLLEIWLGPQDRVIKRIIDYTYGARANIWVMTDDLADEGLIRALYAKRVDGFDVRVLVGPNFGRSAPNSSAVLLRETAGLEKRKISDAVVPTVVLIDTSRDRNGRYNTARGLGVSHPIWSANRLFAGSEVQTDQLADGSMWILDDFSEPSGDLLDLVTLFETAWERGEEL
jgi:hypothetical protein